MIAVDWGTSGFRAYRLDEAGGIRETRTAPAGILTVAAGGFPAALEARLGDWLDDTPIVMSGMIGSRQGWREAPYVECPADAAAIARGLLPVEWAAGRRGWIVPGLSCRDAAGIPDVMRGEETQILGALAALPPADAVICLPGTHSKWARVSDGRILSFATAMTGEVFAVLRRHSILGRSVEKRLHQMAERRPLRLVSPHCRHEDIRPRSFLMPDVSLLLQNSQQRAHGRITRRIGQALHYFGCCRGLPAVKDVHDLAFAAAQYLRRFHMMLRT